MILSNQSVIQMGGARWQNREEKKSERRYQYQTESTSKRSKKSFPRRYWGQGSNGKYHEGGTHTKGGVENGNRME